MFQRTSTILVTLTCKRTILLFASFKRFIARRNLPSDVYCDNASTFKGAKNKLEVQRLIASKDQENEILNFGAKVGINFHFIPKYSPTWGGLWERSVRSVKYHLKRVAGRALLTYEELTTVLYEIEAVLNSRPITAVSDDVNDYSYLTPGHFLTGAPLNTLSENNLTQTPTNLLQIWKICTNLKQIFWAYWQKHYLNLLQIRSKWRDTLPNVKEGDLVILREQDAAPLYWPMARVVKVFQGSDGRVRVVEVRTANGHQHTRSVHKVCLLPINDT